MIRFNHKWTPINTNEDGLKGGGKCLTTDGQAKDEEVDANVANFREFILDGWEGSQI
jgi:hypothetical protein